MMDDTQIAEILESRFGSVSLIKNNVFRSSELYEDRDYAIRYFDLTGNISNTLSRLKEYQEDILAETYFASSSPSDLRWNHYIYLVASEAEAISPSFNEIKIKIESDRAYARKFVITKKEFEDLVAPKKTQQTTNPIDVSSLWIERLNQLNLSYILNESISAPEAVRRIKVREIPELSKEIAPPQLSDSERVAGKSFLKQLSIKSFRDYPLNHDFEFGKVNLIFGRNGTGKTSLLEAIEFLYCGENRRNNDHAQNTKIEGYFVNSNQHLLTSIAKISSKSLRSRNALWYAKSDVQKSTLADSFSKFNFLDTDAAVSLSVEDDSDNRIKRDVARLLLGAEAEKNTVKLERVEEKLRESVRMTGKDVESNNQILLRDRAQLSSVLKTPKQSDTFFSNLLDQLKKLGWKHIPASKFDVSSLSYYLQELLICVNQITRSGEFVSGARGLPHLNRERATLLVSLAEAERIINEINDIRSSLFTNNQNYNAVQKEQIAIQFLLKYLHADLFEKSLKLAELHEKKIKTSLKLAAFGNVRTDLVDFVDSDLTIADAKKVSDDQLRLSEIKLKDQAGIVADIEASMTSINVLKQTIFNLATELLNKVNDPNHCPVCTSQFEDGQLKIQMMNAMGNRGEEKLLEAQIKLRDLELQFNQAKTANTILNKLLSFPDLQDNIQIKNALQIIDDFRVELDQDLLAIKEIEDLRTQYEKEGISEASFKKQLEVIKREKLPSADQLKHLQNDTLQKSSQLKSSIANDENQINTLAQHLVTLTGAPVDIVGFTTDPLTTKQLVARLQEKLVDIESIISAYLTVQSYFEKNITDDFPIDVLLLAQANDSLTRLLTEMEVESHLNSTSKTLEKGIVKLEENQARLSDQLKAMKDASVLISDLLSQVKAGAFTDQVLKSNANTIGEIFSAIHSPTEFKIHTNSANKLLISRVRNNKSVTLDQMSTGQRAAYALSLFLTMNRSLKSGPPLMILDDPIAHVDDLNILSFLDYLREVAIEGSHQIFFATADDKLAGLFRQKFRFLGSEHFQEHLLSR